MREMFDRATRITSFMGSRTAARSVAACSFGDASSRSFFVSSLVPSTYSPTPTLRRAPHARKSELSAIRLRIRHDRQDVIRVEPLRANIVVDDVLDPTRLIDVIAKPNRDLRVDLRIDLLRSDQLTAAQRADVSPDFIERHVAMPDLSAGLLAVHPSEQRHSVPELSRLHCLAPSVRAA